MRLRPSIFTELFKAIDWCQFEAIVAHRRGDAYIKSFSSRDHLIALVFAQFSATDSLRGLEAGWNANSHQNGELDCGRLARATLSDANRRRPAAVFADTFAQLAGRLDRHMRRDGNELIRLIDSTPIPLGKRCDWAKWNGRIRGMKVHVVYDPKADCPRILDITDANVNDAQIGRAIKLEPGATYVFDKGYCHYGWWLAIASAGSVFVTRPKANMRLELVGERKVAAPEGDGFTILEDSEVRFASKGDSKLPVRLRRVVLRRHERGGVITLLTNDLVRSAMAIGTLYKGRWQIELLFRWIKQHLKIRKFLGNNNNAIRLQIFAAMIAFALLRIAARMNRVTLSILRFTDLVAQCLFERRPIATIDQPPPIPAKRRRIEASPDQISFGFT